MQTLLTRSDLAALLLKVSVEDVARESGLSVKTIYRLRQQQNSPTLETAEKVVSAIRRINAVKASPDAKEAA